MTAGASQAVPDDRRMTKAVAKYLGCVADDVAGIELRRQFVELGVGSRRRRLELLDQVVGQVVPVSLACW